MRIHPALLTAAPLSAKTWWCRVAARSVGLTPLHGMVDLDLVLDGGSVCYGLWHDEVVVVVVGGCALEAAVLELVNPLHSCAWHSSAWTCER